MSIDVPATDRIAMSQKERDVLKILHGVLAGERTQAEAARLLRLSVRQVRRLQRKLQADGDQALLGQLLAGEGGTKIGEVLAVGGQYLLAQFGFEAAVGGPAA